MEYFRGAHDKLFLRCNKEALVKKVKKKFNNILGIIKGGGVEMEFSGTRRHLGQLLSEFATAVAYEYKSKRGKQGVTTDPCDVNHLGYCPISFKPREHLWARDRKALYLKAKAKLKRESMSEEDKEKEKKAEKIKKSGRSRFKCEFKCMQKGDRSIDGKVECRSLPKLTVDCVSCGDGQCNRRAIKKCKEEGEGIKQKCDATGVKFGKATKYMNV